MNKTLSLSNFYRVLINGSLTDHYTAGPHKIVSEHTVLLIVFLFKKECHKCPTHMPMLI